MSNVDMLAALCYDSGTLYIGLIYVLYTDFVCDLGLYSPYCSQYATSTLFSQPCSLVDMSVLFNAHCAAVAPSKVQTVQGRKYLGQRCIYRRHEDELFNNTALHFSVYIISKKSVIALYIHFSNLLHFGYSNIFVQGY